MTLGILGSGLTYQHVHWPPGLWWGAGGGLAYALAQFLADCQQGFPQGRLTWLYLAQAAARAILGAIVGAATLALGSGAAFVAGLAGPAALVALGAKFGRRRPALGGKDPTSHADGQPGARSET